MRVVLVGTAAIWIVLELRQSLRHRPEGVKAGWRSEVVFRLIVAAGGVGAAVLAGSAKFAVIRPTAVANWIGVVLFVGGISLRLWSFRTLGRYFTLTVQTSRDQPVIADGPYQLIRHPSYAGLLLIIIAVGLFIGNWLSLVYLTVAMAGGLVFRIRVEERALMRNLGDGYRDYAAAQTARALHLVTVCRAGPGTARLTSAVLVYRAIAAVKRLGRHRLRTRETPWITRCSSISMANGSPR